MSCGMVYNIQTMSTKDGPGLRTTVFLKGCPLRCLWCSNPESQIHSPQLLYFENLCSGCGACVSICPEKACSIANGKSLLSRDLCRECGRCAKSCPTRAREISGKIMSVDDVMRIVMKDTLFYENSNGGVTFGGGEPTAAGEFFLDLAEAAMLEGLHVTVDTCGFCPEERFDKTIELADLFLFDCKHMDPDQHRMLTGQDNVLILRNMKAALESPKEVRIRMPLIPDLNDSESNIAAMADFFGKYGKNEIEIMPYHAFGKSKYEALHKPVPSMKYYTPERLESVRNCFSKHGLSTIIA